MNMDAAFKIARRFITLPLEKRRVYLEKMHEENISPANLPLPSVQSLFDRLPLSYAQQRQWFLWQLEPESTAYNMPTALRFKGDLDIKALRSSFETLIARHETLRTTFRQDGEQAVQVIQPGIDFALAQEELDDASEALIQSKVEEEVSRPFDLEQGPLLRVKLLRLAKDDHVLILTLHHIVSDGWSMPIMVDELVQLYEGYCTGQQVTLPKLPIQYADYAIWQRQWMEAGEQERQLAYWKAQLGDEQPILELPTDRPRPAIQSQEGAGLNVELSVELAQSLKQLAQQQSVTLFMLLLASFQTLLHRYSGQDDIRVGVPNANRNRVETEGLIGFFVNTQVLKAEFDLDTTFSSLLKQVQQTALGAQAQQDLPFEQLVEALHPDRSLSHSPLFQVMFNHQTQVKGESRRLSGLTVEGLSWEKHTAQFDLTLDTFEYREGIGASLSYATALFDKSTVERLAGHWINLLQGIVKTPDQRVAELPLLSPEEQQQIVYDWNRTEAQYPSDQCIHQLIEAQAEKTPGAVAVIFGDQELTYQELNRKANQLAHKLRELGVGPDVLVGIAVERSLEMVIGLLAILKAGGAYVPLDPDYPQDRLTYMMEDSGIQLLLSQCHLQGQLPIPSHVQTLILDIGNESLRDYSEVNLTHITQPENLAYVIYTSGSTGKPKGTLLPHFNVVRLFLSTQDWYQFDAGDVWSVFHSYAFDFSVWELFGALMHGAKAVLVPKEVARSPEDFHALLLRERVTVLNQTPSAFKQLIPEAVEKAQALPLRYVIFGGEALDVGSLEPWFEAFGDRRPQLVNMYGITETTVHVTYRPISFEDLNKEAISPIGEVIPDLSWYLLDGNLGVAIPGCHGELHIGRAGLARGYHHRPALTAERFIPDSFDNSEQGGGRLYRTGDLARYCTDGVIEYIGRIDHQVKIRGFRIELGEIEAQLQSHETVREAVVIDIDGPSGKQLAAYLVSIADQAVTAEQQGELRTSLRDYLKEVLPDYMVPAHLLFLDRLPLTPNGKLDRKALPKPDASQLQQEFVAPQSELEQQIAAIWADVLKIGKVGLTDNFFELGGHSLLATQVISRIRQTLNIELPLRTLFEAPVLTEFVAHAGQGRSSTVLAFKRVDRTRPLALSYAQQRQWFLWQLEPESTAYNMPTALRFKGELDIDALRSSFETLIARHETLRTTFRQAGEQAVQVIHSSLDLALDQECLEAVSEALIQSKVEEEVARPFDLEQGPLLRVKLLWLADDDHVLILTLHHIVSDGWSMPIMVDELVQLYEGYCTGQQVTLPKLPIQYADYAIWQRQWMEAGEQERQLAYWKAQLGDEQPILELPTDRPRPAIQSQEGAGLNVELSVELAQSLKQLAQQQSVTLFMLLLASFQTLLHRYSGQDDIRVGVPNANRNRVETEGLIGFFVNTQVLKAEFDLDTTFSSLLKQVQQTALGAQAQQDLPFEQLVEALHPDRSLSHSPLFQVMFNHQTQVKGESRRLSGLTVEGLSWEKHTAQFDLTLDTFEYREGIGASLSYATALFDKSTVERLAGHWINLLQGIVKTPDQRVAELPLLSPDEQQRIIYDWNRTEASYSSDQCIHQLIEAQAERTPDSVAVVFGDQELTYQGLNRKANQLAYKLRELGVGPDVLVGIAVERSLEMVIGLLAILKAGGAYVPLDPEYPQERLAYMVEDSGIQLLLTQSHLQKQLPISNHIQALVLDQTSGLSEGYSEGNLENIVQPGNLAYVIYTSGSTGRPKGAANTHAGLVNRLSWMQKAYELDAADTILQKTPFSFDVSVWEFFWPLITGARLAMVQPGDHRDPVRLIETIYHHKVTTLHFVPSMLQAFMTNEQVESCISIKRIMCSGEVLPAELAQQALLRLPKAGLFNLYGPTEAAIDVTHWTCHREDQSSIPIGQPIDNLKTHILTGSLSLAGQRIAGELYLGGVGLARGYLQRPALTAERFVPDPFDQSKQGGRRLYRTGDLARYRTDGVIEYVGRIDHQVKIRGFRIELGEIEARLQEHKSVREAVVVDIEGASGKQLVGYLVADPQLSDELEQQATLRSSLRDYLKEVLPDYMVPAHQIFLEALPLTPNGKLDRKALPKPDASQLQQEFVAPQSELEQQIAAIWADVLTVEKVGLTDDFFELGGDSIISIQVVSRARQVGIRFTPRELFQHRTVQGLASVATRGEEGGLQIDQAPVTGEALLLPIHQQFFREDIPERHHWNQALLLEPGKVLNAGQIEQALHALIAHHDALRLNFIQDAGNTWTAYYRSVNEQQSILWAVDVEGEQALEKLCNEAQRSLSLQEGALIRAVLATLVDGSQRLLLVIHHLVVDGVSWRILLEDLQMVYSQLQAGQTIKLPAKTSSTKAWAEHLLAYANSEALQQELGYWTTQLAGTQSELPCDSPEGSLQGQHAASIQTRLDQDYTRQLLQQTPAAYRTQVNDLLLTALARVIGRWTARSGVLIQLEGHGREDLFDDIDLTRTVGWFTSMFPVKLTPTDTLDGSIKGIKEQLRAIPNKGIGFGALRYLGDEAARQALSGLPEPRITFNYLGQFDGSFAQEQDDGEGAFLAPALESSGASQSELAHLGNWLSINGQVYGGELSLNWSFSREMFKAETIQRLAREYAEELKALIEHCVAEDNSGLTPSDVPLAGLSQEQLDSLPVMARDIEDIYPLTPTQQGILFHSLQDDVYVNQTSVPVNGLDIERFIAAWTAAIKAHSILRTSFHTGGLLSEPVQVVHRMAEMDLQVLDWHHLNHGESLDRIDQQATKDRLYGFSLSQAPLMRLTLIQFSDQQHLIWTTHHILMDGWSTSQLIGEVLARYAGQAVEPIICQYSDYLAWLQRQDAGASERFWMEKLDTLSGPTLLADTLPKPDMTSGGHAALYLNWNIEQTASLLNFAKRLKVTPNTVIQAVWLLLLQRYTGQSTVCFGATVSGRPVDLPGMDKVLGLFINTLPVIQKVLPEQQVGQWLQQLQDYNLGIRDYEHTSLADIQRWSGQAGQPLFDSIIVFENYPIDESLRQGAVESISFGQVKSRDVTNYAMDLAIHLGSTLSVEFMYLRDRFTPQDVSQIVESFEHLLQALLGNADGYLGNLLLLPEPEKIETGTSLNIPSLVELIAFQAQRSPQAIAVSCTGDSMTYKDLEQCAGKLANILQARGIGLESRVGVALNRSLDSIVAFYAVLKAGAAYVPLDIDYPMERLEWIIRDSEMSLLLTHSGLCARFSGAYAIDILEIDRLGECAIPSAWPVAALSPDNLAYLIYTSGSTGQPKGVAVSHGPLSMHCQAIVGKYGMDQKTRELLFMSFAFDGAQERWLSVLLSGGEMVLRDQQLWTPEQTLQVLHDKTITIACFPPAYLRELAECAASSDKAPPKVDTYCFGGDAVAEATFELVKSELRPRYLTNGYGPTETVVTPLLWKVDAQQRCGSPVAPIGVVVGARELYVLDTQLNRLPDGVAGELFIGGQGLARGYYARPGLSAERFVADPFSAGGRLYRTGDLVRRRADEVYEYLGRLDQQVKIRGFRIELGEVEARLREQANVRDAVAIVCGGEADRQLVGYVTANGLPLGRNEALREHLRGCLPDYMVPAQIMVLESLPVSPNGKLDRKALPEPDFDGREELYVAPRNALEEELSRIWAEVLGVERIGVTDNFFERGGDSLRSLKVISKVRALKIEGFELKLRDLMARPSIAELSGFGDSAAQLNPLLLLNRQVASATPLFCIHAGFGTVFDYEPVARRLDGVCSVYGLQCRMLLDLGWRDESLAAMAIDYAQYIRQAQPYGPYRLMGWSLGGILAVLVAAELEQQGQEVEFLSVVDSFIPSETGAAEESHGDERDWRHDLQGFIHSLYGRVVEELPPSLWDKTCEPTLKPLVDVFTGLNLASASPHNRVARAFDAEDLAQAFIVGMRLKALSAKAISIPVLKALVNIWWAQSEAHARHKGFENALGAEVVSLCVDSDHYSILKDSDFLAAQERILSCAIGVEQVI
ncbi:non-ribosomal peptide synthase/polyketide synthase [Stutzerimonas kirkiae]|uniref:non-ribosomal peptide synthase/polyketide synthase n=1 Tax=Stutzerimonas kirkiae TaxID=2211392 RepID=UPI0010384DE0|nr:non-ribosomal peptide synthase/polyketide synthase [Stutzerimonas kirkiae]TBV11413.1 non-ribosomal peptide synthetase [Stutzerimonas kirkiae]